MARRDWPLMVHCGHQGCTERATYRYQTKRDLTQSFEANNFTAGRWRCTRHSKPGDVLSTTNLTTSCELTVEQREYGRFFGNSGFIHGPGFKAFAEDFPAGTKIIITATLVLPESSVNEAA